MCRWRSCEEAAAAAAALCPAAALGGGLQGLADYPPIRLILFLFPLNLDVM
jgi:hypothetical protein